MQKLSQKHILVILLFLALLLIVIPLTLMVIQRSQENRSRAVASTTLSFSPLSSATTPITKNVNDPLALTVQVNPGQNLVSVVKLEVDYDPTKLTTDTSTATSCFTVTSTVLNILEGPICSTPGKVQIVLGIADPTKAIATATNIGTVNFSSVGNTAGAPTQITFGSITSVYSIAASDQPSENVLSSTSPAYVTAGSATTPTTIPPTNTPTNTPVPPTITPTPIVRNTVSGTIFIDSNRNGIKDSNETSYSGSADIKILNASGSGTNATTTNGNYTSDPLPAGSYVASFQVPNGYLFTYPANGSYPIAIGSSCSVDTSHGASCSQGNIVNLNFGIVPNPTATATPAPNTTQLLLTVILHGVGIGGDNSNPKNRPVPTQGPLHMTRPVSVTLTDDNNNKLGTVNGSLSYSTINGIFSGSVDLGALGNTLPPTGDYLVQVKVQGYLPAQIPSIQKITTGRQNSLADVTLVTGDINNDNQIDILDYNTLLDCGYGALNPLPESDPSSVYNSTACQAHGAIAQADVDLNDDGIVNIFDYNLFIREVSVQYGL